MIKRYLLEGDFVCLSLSKEISVMGGTGDGADIRFVADIGNDYDLLDGWNRLDR